MANDRIAPTLDDVARQAGVSTATVSRCLNTPDRVGRQTRERVLAVVDALGYTPNFAARVMAAKRSYTIGAIIPTMENAIFARGLQAFQEGAQARGYTLLVASSAYEPVQEREQIRTLAARGADGLLLIGHDRDAEVVDYLRRQGLPVLVAWSHVQGAVLQSVGFDNRAAMGAMAEHILSLGHRRLAMISAPTATNDRARLRVEGLQAALAAHGLPPAPVVETPYSIENGAQAMDKLMARVPRPTVVLCGNDVLAVGALRAAQARGLSVPGDVSVTGFDDMELAQIVTPPLATVHVPHRTMGLRAAEVLIGMIEDEAAVPSSPLATEIRARASLAAPPDAGA